MKKRKYEHIMFGRCYGQHYKGLDEIAHETPAEISGYKKQRKRKKIIID